MMTTALPIRARKSPSLTEGADGSSSFKVATIEMAGAFLLGGYREKYLPSGIRFLTLLSVWEDNVQDPLATQIDH